MQDGGLTSTELLLQSLEGVNPVSNLNDVNSFEDLLMDGIKLRDDFPDFEIGDKGMSRGEFARTFFAFFMPAYLQALPAA